MKKTLFMAAAVVMTLAACSNDEDAIKINKGMTLTANVENTETRATIEKEGSVWHFNWENGDAVSVTSPSKTYTFTKSETKNFSCDEAVPENGEWKAYFPSNATLSIINQGGTKEYVANNYFVEGSTTISDLSSNLEMTMIPKVAVLHVTNTGSLEYHLAVCAENCSMGDRKWIQSVNVDGSTNIASSEKYVGTIAPGDEKYFIIPAGNIKLLRKSSSSTGFTKQVKTVVAGKVYNFNVGASSI